MKKDQVQYDYAGMMAETIGPEHGISKEEVDGYRARLGQIQQEMAARRGDSGYGFLDQPHQDPTPILSLARNLVKTWEDFVHIGIGGSALGTKALLQALLPLYWNFKSRSDRKGRPRIHILENIDPDEVTALLSLLNPKKTVVHVVTKSGETTETMANFMIVREWLARSIGKDKARKAIIATTDPDKGPLRKLVQTEGYASLSVPPTVGGRFSVLTAVGLYPAAVVGINIRELLAGAEEMERRCRDSDPWKNPAMLRAVLLYLSVEKKKKPITVLMPYVQALTGFADWYVQLAAESLGKRKNIAGQTIYAGLTPIRAVGATDQHSQLQLFLEGPHDKTITFLKLKKFRSQSPVPRAAGKVNGIEELAGHTLEKLIHLEQEATGSVLTQSRRPHGRLILPRLTPFTLGQLIYLCELEVVYTAGLFGINPFDQPAVQAGKEIVHRALLT